MASNPPWGELPEDRIDTVFVGGELGQLVDQVVTSTRLRRGDVLQLAIAHGLRQLAGVAGR